MCNSPGDGRDGGCVGALLRGFSLWLDSVSMCVGGSCVSGAWGTGVKTVLRAQARACVCVWPEMVLAMQDRHGSRLPPLGDHF